MNILVVAQYQNDGSPTAIFVHDQMLAYQKLGHYVRAVVPIPIGKRALNGHRWETGLHREDIDGIPHYFIRHLSLSNYGKKHINSATALHVLRKNLSSILEGFSPNVIHAHTLGLASNLGSWLKEQIGVPLVVTTHGGDTFLPFMAGKYAALKQLADRADYLACVSTLLKRRMEDCNAAVPMSVILNGFEIQNVIVQANKAPVSIVQAGSLIERKKTDVTIQAFAALQKQYSDASLDIIGSGSEQKHLERLCKGLGVSDNVHFHGFLPNSETLIQMAASRFFIMPSVREGFGIVYLEAMASGCITIGTEGEGIADLIVSGENGFLVPPDDPDSIVQTVEWCLEYPDQANAIAEKGRRDAMSLTWEKNAEMYLTLFEELII